MRTHASAMLWCVCLLGPSALWAPTEQTPDRAAQEALLDRALELGGQEVPPDQVEVAFWQRVPIEAERVVRVGSQFFVLEKKSGRVRAGWAEGPGQVEVGAWATAEDVLAQLAVPPLPAPPAGFTLRTILTPGEQGVRVTGDPSGRWLYILGLGGTVERHDTQTGKTVIFARPQVYAAEVTTALMAQGLCFDDAGRMYVVANVRDEEARPQLNHVTIYRSAAVEHGGAVEPELTPWVRTRYPWGGHHYNHGVGNIALGPDGMLYVGSGSRTDANEDFDEPEFADGGEVELTACLWRLDPDADAPQIEVVARGLRNAYGFDWDADGQLWATDNGPNRDPPGELNRVEVGVHYGFPYRFSDWPDNPYPHVAAPPADLAFVDPVLNVGPDGGGSAEHPIATFDAHSSPNGLAFLGDAFPESVRGALAVARFGNQIRSETVGYDLLLVRPLPEPDASGRWRASVHAWVTGLARPLDVYAAPTGRLYILEHSRKTAATKGWAADGAAGRLLEIAPVE